MGKSIRLPVGTPGLASELFDFRLLLKVQTVMKKVCCGDLRLCSVCSVSQLPGGVDEAGLGTTRGV